MATETTTDTDRPDPYNPKPGQKWSTKEGQYFVVATNSGFVHYSVLPVKTIWTLTLEAWQHMVAQCDAVLVPDPRHPQPGQIWSGRDGNKRYIRSLDTRLGEAFVTYDLCFEDNKQCYSQSLSWWQNNIHDVAWKYVGEYDPTQVAASKPENQAPPAATDSKFVVSDLVRENAELTNAVIDLTHENADLHNEVFDLETQLDALTVQNSGLVAQLSSTQALLGSWRTAALSGSKSVIIPLTAIEDDIDSIMAAVSTAMGLAFERVGA